MPNLYPGWDVTPAADCAKYELHISGDISYAIAQYLYATNDTSVIQDLPDIQAMKADGTSIKDGPPKTLMDILVGVAHFWVSTMTFNQQKQLYEIKGKLKRSFSQCMQRNIRNFASCGIFSRRFACVIFSYGR